MYSCESTTHHRHRQRSHWIQEEFLAEFLLRLAVAAHLYRSASSLSISVLVPAAQVQALLSAAPDI
jgi:hypothetical protein